MPKRTAVLHASIGADVIRGFNGPLLLTALPCAFALTSLDSLMPSGFSYSSLHRGGKGPFNSFSKNVFLKKGYYRPKSVSDSNFMPGS